MVSFAEVIGAAQKGQGTLKLQVPSDWRQGRTAYGGFTAAVACQAALQLGQAPPPLRSALISFIGPVSGEIEARAEILRQGRSSLFVKTDVFSNEALAFSANYVFMSNRDSVVDFPAEPAPIAPPPGEAVTWDRKDEPAFARQFDFKHALERSEIRAPRFRTWTRLKHREGVATPCELLLLADALPPAALNLLRPPAPVSSVTWMLNILTATPSSPDGWWLLDSSAQEARHGLSSQSMGLWSSAGEAVALGMQSAALFG